MSMIDYLLRLTTSRSILLILMIIVSIILGRQYNQHPPAWYLRWRYPPQANIAPLGAEIVLSNEKAARARILALHRHVLDLIALAQRRAIPCNGFRAKADAALLLNTPEHRDLARQMLEEVKRDIPADMSAEN